MHKLVVWQSVLAVSFSSVASDRRLATCWVTHPKQTPVCDIIAKTSWGTQHMYTFLKALDEKRSNPWYYRCQTLVWKKSSRRATSAHWENFWVALLRGTIPVQIKVWWSDHPWSVLYSSRAFRRYIILGVTPLNSKFQKFDNVTSLGGVTQQVACTLPLWPL